MIHEILIDEGIALEVDCRETLTLWAFEADEIRLADVGALSAVYGSSLSDSVGLNAAAMIDGVPFDCWCFSSGNFFPSVYSNFGFNSFCSMGGEDFGADDAGIYVIDSDTDDGKPFFSGIIFHYTDFGSVARKKFRKLFFSGSGDNVTVQLKTDNGARVFQAKKNEVSVTRDLRGRSWQVTISGFATFNYYEIFPVTLTR